MKCSVSFGIFNCKIKCKLITCFENMCIEEMNTIPSFCRNIKRLFLHELEIFFLPPTPEKKFDKKTLSLNTYLRINTSIKTF